MNIHESQQQANRVAVYPSDDFAPSHNFGKQVVSPKFDLDLIFEFARRRVWIILFCVLLMSGVGLTYFVAMPAPYVATATLQIDPRKFKLFQQPADLGEQQFPALDSQMEMLKSENLALKVISEEHLADDPEFGMAPAIPILSNLIESPRPDSKDWRTRNALRIFEKRLSVLQRGAYLIDINFESVNAERAAKIANLIAQAYLASQIDTAYQVTREGSKWLEGRLTQLRDQLAGAENAVIDYKTKNKIVDAGNGRPLSAEEVRVLNEQIAAARTRLTIMRGRLDRIDAALDDPGQAITNVVDGKIPSFPAEIQGVGNPLNNPLIIKLRAQYLELAEREALYSNKYGRNHGSVVKLRDDMRGLQASMLAELRRLRDSYNGDYEAAREAERLTETQLGKAITESQSFDEAQVTLRRLEASAQTYKSLYDNFLNRYSEAVELQSFPYTEGRLITTATPPIKRNYKQTLLIAAVTPIVGLFLGIGLGALRDSLERGFRTATQVETLLDLTCIALIPSQTGVHKRRKGRAVPAPSVLSGVSREENIGLTVVEQPFSRFAEAIRTIKLAADLNGVVSANKVIGITSAVPDEGKSTIAAALAYSTAQFGERVVLVDCDFRNPSLSRALAPTAQAGILEALGQMTLDEALCKDPVLNLAFLPIVSSVPIANSSEILTSSSMKKLFEKLRLSYNFVIVDLPPLAPLADVRGTTHLVDSYLLVVKWGNTYKRIVRYALIKAPRVYEKVLGAVLNKVDLKALKLYEGNQARYYHDKTYGRYGYTD